MYLSLTQFHAVLVWCEFVVLTALLTTVISTLEPYFDYLPISQRWGKTRVLLHPGP